MPQQRDEKVLITIESLDGAPSAAAAAQQLGVQAADLDSDFGVVPVDPRRGLYSVLVRTDRLPSALRGEEDYHGPYANPRIEAMGPLRQTQEDAADPPQSEPPQNTDLPKST